MVINTRLVARLQQSTFGVFGLGRIGTAAALRGKAFGFNVLFYDPKLPNGVDKILGIERTQDVKDFSGEATLPACTPRAPARHAV